MTLKHVAWLQHVGYSSGAPGPEKVRCFHCQQSMTEWEKRRCVEIVQATSAPGGGERGH